MTETELRYLEGQAPDGSPVLRLCAEIRRLRAIFGLDDGRCSLYPGGERCALPAGHTGKCLWDRGD